MKRTLSAILLSLSAIGLFSACTPAQARQVERAMHHNAEDSGHFRCATQGNGICGPTAINLTNHTVVAQNGQFPYTELLSHANRPLISVGYYCARGPRPIGKHDITDLTCTSTIIA